MSLAHKKLTPVPVGDGSGKFWDIKPQYQGIKRITRRFRVEGGALNKADKLESHVFDDYGTLDGETTAPADYRRTVPTDEKFADCYLEIQEQDKGRGDGKETFLTKVYQEAYDTIREVEKPVETTDENGRKITRRTYIILNTAPPANSEFDPSGPAVEDPDDATQKLYKQTKTIGNAVTIIQRDFIEVTSDLTQVGGDLASYTENGLKVIDQTFIVTPDYDFDSFGTVGTTLYEGLTLAQFREVESNGTFVRMTAKWVEAGILSKSFDYVGSQQAIVIESIGPDPSTPAGYELAKKTESNFQGYQTNQFTYLEPSILSTSNDLVGSQQAIVIEVFGSGNVPITPVGYEIAKKSVSNVDGIETTQYTFLEPSEISRSNDFVGSQQAEVVEVFGTGNVPTATNGSAILAKKSVSNVDGIETTQYTFLEPSELSRSNDLVGSQQAEVVEVFGPGETPLATNGGTLAKTAVSNVDGIPTTRYTFLVPSVLSRNIQEKNGGTGVTGAIRTETVEAFNLIPTSTIAGVKVGEQTSDVDGIPTTRYTFILGEGQLSVSTRSAPGALATASYVTIDSVGTPVVPPGELVESSDSNEDGFIRYRRTSIQNVILGTQYSYDDVVDVQIPGTVDCTTIEVSSGGITGTIAVPKVQPRRSSKINATVTVSISTAPVGGVVTAYDLGQISCSVTTTNVNLSRSIGAQVSATSGNFTVSDNGYRQSFNASSRVSTYPGCYLLIPSSEGAIEYISAYQPFDDDGALNFTDAVSSRQTKCVGTGATSAVGYTTTGVLKRTSRPILTTLSGLTYYEVITIETA